MKKRIFSFFVCLLIFSITLTTTPTFAKFYGTSQGCLFGALFSDFQFIATEFVATESEQSSETLWGIGEDATKLERNSEYAMNNLKNVKFSIYNSSDKDLLINFVCIFYAGPYLQVTMSNFEVSLLERINNEDVKVTESIMSAVVKSATFSALGGGISSQPSAGYYGDENLTLTGDTISPSWLLGDYREHELIIIPTIYYKNAPVGTVEEERRLIETYYVLKPGARKTYSISSDYDAAIIGNDTLYNAYSVVKMKVQEYTGYTG